VAAILDFQSMLKLQI